VIFVIKYALLMMLLLMSLISDVKTRKIKNLIVFSFMVMGVLIGLCETGLVGILNSMCGIILPILILFPLFVLKMLGAGDIKCFSAIGAIMGAGFAAESIIYSFIVGGVIALIIMLFNNNAVKRFKGLLNYLKTCILTFSITQYDDLKRSEGAFRFTYAVVIGVIINLYFFQSKH